MAPNRKDLICRLLKGIETGDPAAVAVVNPEKYIQHNPETPEGGEGLAALFKRLARSSPRVNIPRVFEDGDYVFAHTEYDFASLKIGFEIFRFENDLVVEHWDNIQERQGPNPSGHTMVDGQTQATEIERTESNRRIVQSFIGDVLIDRQLDKLRDYVSEESFIQHSPQLTDGLEALRTALQATSDEGDALIRYERLHRLLAEGSFVLAVSEGHLNGVHTSCYDLFRLSQSKLVEHWDTTEEVPPRTEWKNENGKF
jgi:predicted SnoaL-like aldol condensation-catalyzing enzyme